MALKRPTSVKNVLVTFKDQDEASKALSNGLRFQCFYIHTEEFTVYPDPGVTRCFKCQRYGHIAARCENIVICSLCGVEGHGWQSPECSANKNKKEGVTVKPSCVNCKGEHQTGSRTCTFYKEEKRRLYSEIAQNHQHKAEKARNKAIEVMGEVTNNTVTFNFVEFTMSLLKGIEEMTGGKMDGSIVLRRLKQDLGGEFAKLKTASQ